MRTMRTSFIMKINGHSTINLSYSEKNANKCGLEDISIKKTMRRSDG
jgi:hypothetical protein